MIIDFLQSYSGVMVVICVVGLAMVIYLRK